MQYMSHSWFASLIVIQILFANYNRISRNIDWAHTTWIKFHDYPTNDKKLLLYLYLIYSFTPEVSPLELTLSIYICTL